MKLPRANFSANADAGTPIPENETEFGRSACSVMDHQMVVSADGDMAIVRVSAPGHQVPKVYVGMTGSRALDMSIAFREAAYRADPSLKPAEQPLQAIAGGKS